ncbi:MAG: 4Fe-4S dicluster domain-containing protein [Bacteroidota bacterium]|nr:4Fe-4S dicluster domain-containing protein [Bacteroidota bacterium]
MNISEKILNAGIVGAGGGGFPTHVKAGAKVEYVIANGAECEPLIHKDYEVMVRYPDKVVQGVMLLIESTGAKKGIIGIKEKNKEAIDAISGAIHDPRIKIHLLGDFYPSGDEFILVYESTKRLIPPQGIPLDVGIVVSNVETLYNISLAAEDQPVTEKFITVAGAVHRPLSFVAPVGTSFKDAIAFAGGVTVKDFGVFVGGIMMGKLEFDLDQPITKTTAGLIVLPKEHILIQRKSRTEQSMRRIGKSACDQCSYCTELCPRYILGYDVQPHKVMRSLGFTMTGEQMWNQYASLCCACGLCTLYACPENLYPKEACDTAKADLRTNSVKWSGRKEVIPHPMYEGRRTPLKQLIKRLGIEEYNHPSKFQQKKLNSKNVNIPLSQHIGTPAQPIVSIGELVKRGQLIGEIPDAKLGARVHASIDGVIKSVNRNIVIENY